MKAIWAGAKKAKGTQRTIVRKAAGTSGNRADSVGPKSREDLK